MSLSSLTQTHRVKIERSTDTRDASGGYVKTWDTLVPEALVGIQPSTSRERTLFAQRQISYTNKIYSDRDYGVRKDDRLIDLTTDKEYVVIGVSDQAGRGLVFCIEARDID